MCFHLYASVRSCCSREGGEETLQRDVGVERAVCAILLGNVEAAEAALGLCPDSTDAPDSGVQTFVLVCPSLQIELAAIWHPLFISTYYILGSIIYNRIS